jgi:hypothetical protein
MKFHGGSMTRAHYRYVTESWIALFEETGLTVARVARETEVQERTFYNILANNSERARHRTRRKILDGLSRLNISAERSDELFSKG